MKQPKLGAQRQGMSVTVGNLMPMKQSNSEHKCPKCEYKTDTITLGHIRIGCPNCGYRDAFKEHDKPEYDALMRHLM